MILREKNGATEAIAERIGKLQVPSSVIKMLSRLKSP